MNRRTTWRFRFLAAFCFLAVQPLWGAVAVSNLLCGLASNPLGLDETSPRLSWQLHATAPGLRGQAQTAYQILVAASTNALAAGHGDLWDSGKVNSDSSLNVTYAGASLASEQQVFWKVRAWDQDGRPSEWSSMATWTMGLLNPTDWQGKWICASSTGSVLPVFRREFTVRRGLQRAVITICGLGQYELSANGAKVGDALVAPGWSKYDKTCLYDTLDITSCLTNGLNALGVMLGNGMYNVPVSARFAKFTGSFGVPKLIAQLHLFYADGTDTVIATDPQWRTTPGPITFSSVYGGEDYDAQLEPAGWNRPGFNAAAWSPATVTNSPGGTLRGLSCAAPPLKAIQTLQPVRTNVISAGKLVYDLGQNAALIPRLTAQGPAGAVVRIIPAELTNSDGTVNRGSVGGGPAYWQYTLAGTGTEEWFPRFFYHGCRYLQVELSPAAGSVQLPVVDHLEGVVIQSASPPAGEFVCSNDLFNRIHTLIRWAQ
ncbi:MAG TPA: family 78 glycoside hydrolase catalytic domain, partial [Candidatus Acidoferrum sp.]|nr:family 78 glycoside hydrolase catalytic domain [Candidatus Acidoferrum sp.]